MMTTKLVGAKRIFPILIVLTLMSSYILLREENLSMIFHHFADKNYTKNNSFELETLQTKFRKYPSPKFTIAEIAITSNKNGTTLQNTSFISRSSMIPNQTLREELKAALKKAKQNLMYILIWDPPFGTTNHRADPRFDECGACEVTYNKSMITKKETKAVLFHFLETTIDNMPPSSSRRPDQLFVWWSAESPPTIAEVAHRSLREFDNVFNLTMTYRRDSGVYHPYGLHGAAEHYLFNQNGKEKINQILAQKKHLAVWLVSNCEVGPGAAKRFEFVKTLVKAGLDLHQRGRCFPENGEVKSKDIIKDYKFYFAFENSFHCTDYITEKLVNNSFAYDAVPVVWGAKKSDYEAIVPSKSYIFAEDFKHPADLVKYLNYLDKNDSAYREYFMWRTKGPAQIPQFARERKRCLLCRMMHGINVDIIYHPDYEKLKTHVPMFGYSTRPRIVPSLHNWFFGNVSRDCLPQKI